MWLDVREKIRTVRTGVFYRLPNQSPEVDELMVGEVNRGCTRQTVILGDFSLSSVNWETMVGDAKWIKFIGSFHDNYLVQVVDKPTRGAKILDLILTNMEHYVKEVEVGETWK